MKSETVKATEIKEGDEVFFPNSRHPQTVTKVEHDPVARTNTLHAEEAQWVCADTYDVKRKVSDGD